MLQSMGSQRVTHDLATEQHPEKTIILKDICPVMELLGVYICVCVCNITQPYKEMNVSQL